MSIYTSMRAWNQGAGGSADKREDAHSREPQKAMLFSQIADRVPTMLWMTDASAKAIYFNKRWLEFRGKSLEEELGVGWQSDIHPEDLKLLEDANAEALRTRTRLVREFRIRCADSSYRWIQSVVLPQFDDKGVFAGLVGSSTDITESYQESSGQRYQDRLTRATADVARILLSCNDPSDKACLKSALRTLGNAAEADRAYIFQLWSHPRTMELLADQLCEWCSDRVKPQIDNAELQALPVEQVFSRATRLFRNDEAYKCIVSQATGNEREQLASQDIRSLMILPIFVEGRLWGCIGLDDCQTERVWSEEEEAMLRTMAANFASLFGHHEMEQLIQFRGNLLRGIGRATHELLVSPDLDAGLYRALEALGTSVNVPRIYLFEYLHASRPLAQSLRVRAFWATPSGKENKAGVAARIVGEIPDRWLSVLAEGQSISGHILDLLQLDATPAPREVRNILLVPIISGGQPWGVIGFDTDDLTFRWTTTDEDLLKAAASSIGTAIARHDAERSLRQSEVRHRTVIENASDVIAVVNAHGVITYISEAVGRTLNYAPTALVGRRASALLHPDEVYALTQIQRALRADPDAIWLADLQLRHQDGSWNSFEAAIRLLKTARGAEYVVNARDTTERKKTEAALKKSQEMLLQSQKMEAMGQLAGGVAHDFNNLLTAILGYAELALDPQSTPESMRQDIQAVIRATEHAHELTKQLLAFSRKQTSNPALLDLNTIVLDAEKLLRRLIGENIDLSTEIDPDLGSIRVNRGQTEQVITNLAVNARDAMPHGGRLTIQTANVDVAERIVCGAHFVEPNAYVLLRVIDTGKGMGAETMAHIFEPFFSTKEVGKGTGLGLAMVYGIVKQAGGAITAESEPGRGAIFSVYFPRVDEEAPADAAAQQPVSTKGNETILLVEDEDLVRDFTAKVLEQHGYRVTSAPNGREALKIAEQNHYQFDLLITDIVMPYMSGSSLADQLTARAPDLKVLFISGYARDSLAGMRNVEEGKNFMPKPFKSAQLTARVREVLDAH